MDLFNLILANNYMKVKNQFKKVNKSKNVQ
jgi:hypothetical protein